MDIGLEGTPAGYLLPPPLVVSLVDAPPEPQVSISPDHKWMLFLQRSSHPSIADLARPICKLAGYRFDPTNRGSVVFDYWTGMELRRLDGGEVLQVALPKDIRILRAVWSHTSQAVALACAVDDRIELWWFATDKPQQPKRLVEFIIESLPGFSWCSDGKRLICFLPGREDSARPIAPRAPVGPVIEESMGVESPSRTYQDLLASHYDADLFEYLLTTQIAVVDPETGDVEKVGKPDLYLTCSQSPNDEYFLVTRLKKPFSFTLPYPFFPRCTEVWNRSGRVEFTVADLPLADSIPIEGVRVGPRNISWKAGEPAQVMWVEALDSGDTRNKVEHRDRLVKIDVPQLSPAEELLRIQHRYTGRTSLQKSHLLLVSEYDRERRWTRTMLHDLQNREATPRVMSDRSVNDHYGDPGSVLMAFDETGCAVAKQFQDSLFLAGHGATPEGALPFLDVWDLTSWQWKRLWRCEPGCLESVISVRLANDSLEIITRHESRKSPPNCRLRSLIGDQIRPLTEFSDPTPLLRSFHKRLVKYYRQDGTELSATLYLPADYQEGTRLPLLIWAYPQEYNDPNTAGQVTSSPDRFTRLSGCSHLTLLTEGFAILDNATMPVIGQPETMNDTFLAQVISSAKAAIDFAVEAGVADRERVAIGGHSYGAFMVANLLAHSDLFRAGIARSGAYNRTLTPFGFQSERRPLWQAKEIYHNLSPFQFAEQIKNPMLLIHGEDDNNPGTLSLQSKRMYQAIKGNGGICRLVLLPHESHGYKARESILHTQAEMIQWLNAHVRDTLR